MLSLLIFTEILLIILVAYMMITKHTAICVVISNIISAVMVFIYCALQAPDIAITEAVIGTATSTILFALTLVYIRKIKTDNIDFNYTTIDIRQRLFVFILCSIVCILLIYIVNNIPVISKNMFQDIKPIAFQYIANSIKDFGFSSIVTAVVAGYRAFDTMFEDVVIFTACYGFYIILTLDIQKEKEDKYLLEDNKKQIIQK